MKTRTKGYKYKLVDCSYCKGKGFIRTPSEGSDGYVDNDCCECSGTGAKLKPCGYKTIEKGEVNERA
jgi:hypothetical protein